MSEFATQEQMDSLAPVTEREPLGSALYNRILEHLYDEATLLDKLELRQWQKSFTEDIQYQAPVKITTRRSEKFEPRGRMMHLFENYYSMDLRIHKVQDTNVCWAEEPRSRTRRLITNVLVNRTARPDEYAVMSNFLLSRNRFESSEYQILTGERIDRLRLIDDEIKLARREIHLDMSVLSMPNLAVFL